MGCTVGGDIGAAAEALLVETMFGADGAADKVPGWVMNKGEGTVDDWTRCRAGWGTAPGMDLQAEADAAE